MQKTNKKHIPQSCQIRKQHLAGLSSSAYLALEKLLFSHPLHRRLQIHNFSPSFLFLHREWFNSHIWILSIELPSLEVILRTSRLTKMASSSTPKDLSAENQSLPASEFLALLEANKKFKARSHDTYLETHLPELTREPKSPIDTVLIGDSMLERLKTTGTFTKTAKLPSSFNAGVGGDKIENVLYRLDLGMQSLLEDRNVKLWVLMIGSNNLKKALKKAEVEKYRLLVQALLRIAPMSKVLACELFKRKDIDDAFVDESNRLLRELIREMNANLGESIYWLEAPSAITKEVLVDHVHFNMEGYRIWDEALSSRIEELLV